MARFPAARGAIGPPPAKSAPPTRQRAVSRFSDLVRDARWTDQDGFIPRVLPTAAITWVTRRPAGGRPSKGTLPERASSAWLVRCGHSIAVRNRTCPSLTQKRPLWTHSRCQLPHHRGSRESQGGAAYCKAGCEGCLPGWSPPVLDRGVGSLSTSGFRSTGATFILSAFDFAGSVSAGFGLADEGA